MNCCKVTYATIKYEDMNVENKSQLNGFQF